MEFEAAAQRLAREQKNYRGRKEVVVSQKAKREADYRRKQQAKLKEERERQARIAQYQQQYITNCDRGLKVKRLASQLQAASIWGEGDKIALPPSLLETLTAADTSINNVGGNPWIFRIGILNPQYNYPSSILLQTLKPPKEEDSDDSEMDEEDDNDKAAYLDELSYKYLSYTHSTVVEFTQEEGHVGIPQPIADALLDPARRRKQDSFEIPTTRTVDPAAKSFSDDATDNNDNNNMDEDNTPGHLAWGAFDIPSLLLEISLVQLPKGRGCTLVPTKEAIQNNFHGLQDVKLVLEQSLIRTRATLAVGDTVQTWHRGTKFDLKVTKVIPSTFHAVTCINTDIEVDIGEAQGSTPVPASNTVPPQQQGNVLGGGGGHTLGSSSRSSSTTPMTTSTLSSIQQQQQQHISNNAPVMVLLPEPSEDQTEGICTVQIRCSSGGTGRRRFHVHEAKLQDLFDFAASISKTKVGTFQLVSRFPRRIFTSDSDTSSAASTLATAGIQSVQELLMVEPR
jgi:hypothetical protein